MSPSSPSPSPEKAVRVGVGVVVVRAGRVLLGLRQGAHGAGTWALPGGHLEFGETPADCARREVLEETGLQVTAVWPGAWTNDLMPEVGRHYLTVLMHVQVAEGEPQRLEPHKCAAWRWCDWHDLPSPLFGPLASMVARGWRPDTLPAGGSAKPLSGAPATASAPAPTSKLSGTVLALALDDAHRFSKRLVPQLQLLAGLGVQGDSHAGVTVQHRSRVARDPSQPNLRQVHLLASELLDTLAAQGLAAAPGQMGENITTRGLDLLALPTGTRLHIGPQAVVQLTGLRNPCAQIEAFQPGLLAAVLGRAADGTLVRKAGVMAVVLAGGPVRAGDAISAVLPEGERQPLQPV